MLLRQAFSKNPILISFSPGLCVAACLLIALCIRPATAGEIAVSPSPKKMLMVFTQSIDTPPGRWMYLVFNEAFKRIGMKLELAIYPPNRAGALADAGAVDGELGRMYSYQNNHPDLIRVDEPLSRVSWAAYATSPTIKISGWESLHNMPFRVEYRAGMAIPKLRLSALIGQENLSYVNNVSSGLRKLQAGRTDIYVDLEEIVSPCLQSNQFRGMAIRKAGVLEEETLHAYFHKKNKSLAPGLSAALKTMKHDGLFDAYWTVVNRETVTPVLTDTLQNGGFEEVNGQSVRFWEYRAPANSVIPDSTVFSEGKRSLQIHLQEHIKEEALVFQEVEVEAGKRYDLGAKTKVDLVHGMAEVAVIFMDKNRKEIEKHALPHQMNSGEWLYQNTWVQSPNGADRAMVSCAASGKGRAWFDDVHFTPKISGGY